MIIKLDMSEFFDDERKLSLLYIDPKKKQKTVTDIIQYICETFSIEECPVASNNGKDGKLYLSANDVFIPSNQPSYIVNDVKDILRLKKVASKAAVRCVSPKRDSATVPDRKKKKKKKESNVDETEKAVEELGGSVFQGKEELIVTEMGVNDLNHLKRKRRRKHNKHKKHHFERAEDASRNEQSYDSSKLYNNEDVLHAEANDCMDKEHHAESNDEKRVVSQMFEKILSLEKSEQLFKYERKTLKKVENRRPIEVVTQSQPRPPPFMRCSKSEISEETNAKFYSLLEIEKLPFLNTYYRKSLPGNSSLWNLRNGNNLEYFCTDSNFKFRKSCKMEAGSLVAEDSSSLQTETDHNLPPIFKGAAIRKVKGKKFFHSVGNVIKSIKARLNEEQEMKLSNLIEPPKTTEAVKEMVPLEETNILTAQKECSEMQFQTTESSYESLPILPATPNVGDIIVSKFMSVDETYSPYYSDYRTAKVTAVNGLKLSLQFLEEEGTITKDNWKPLGKMGANSCIDVDWRDLKDCRLVFP